MIIQTAHHLHRLPTWAYLLLVTFMLSVGMIVIVSSASAQMSIGGRVLSYVPSPPGPCTYGIGFTVGPPAPSKPPCIVWAMGLPPIGASFLGLVAGPYVIMGGFGL